MKPDLRISQDVQEDTLHVHRPVRMTMTAVRTLFTSRPMVVIVIMSILFTVRMTMSLLCITRRLGMRVTIRMTVIVVLHRCRTRARSRRGLGMRLEVASGSAGMGSSMSSSASARRGRGSSEIDGIAVLTVPELLGGFDDLSPGLGGMLVER
jgi:hypothetical protein